MSRKLRVLSVFLALVAAGCGSSGSESTAADGSETSPTAAGESTTTSETEESTTTAPAPAEPAAPDASPYVVAFGDLSVLSFPAGDPGELTVVSTGAQDELNER